MSSRKTYVCPWADPYLLTGRYGSDDEKTQVFFMLTLYYFKFYLCYGFVIVLVVCMIVTAKVQHDYKPYNAYFTTCLRIFRLCTELFAI